MLERKEVIDKNGHKRVVYVNPDKIKRGHERRVAKVAPFVATPETFTGYKEALFRRAKTQRRILEADYAGLPYSDLIPSIEERDEWYRKGDELAAAGLPRDDGTREVLTHGQLLVSGFTENGNKVGYEGNLLHPEAERDELIAASADVSQMWLESCSSAEAYALAHYSAGASDDYARLTSLRGTHEGDAEPLGQVWEDFEAAVDNSPILAPFVTFTGVNDRYVEGILRQLEEGNGVITLDRVFSSSLNPAQVNGFATGDQRLVLEVETTRGACMELFSHSPREMEVLLPRGRYQVIDTEDDVVYSWLPDEVLGVDISKVIRLRHIGD